MQKHFRVGTERELGPEETTWHGFYADSRSKYPVYHYSARLRQAVLWDSVQHYATFEAIIREDLTWTTAAFDDEPDASLYAGSEAEKWH